MRDLSRTILVCGATGRQGGAVIRHLLATGHQVRALTRNPGKPAARDLSLAGAQVFSGDLDDPGSLDAAIKGCYGVFSVQTFAEEGLEAEVRQGCNIADAARREGIEHFVYSSVGGAERDTGIPHFESKCRIEEYLAELDLPRTVLRPVFFMENFLGSQMKREISSGRFSLALPPDRPLQMIAVWDIGGLAAKAFSEPELFMGREMEIAGDELTMQQVADRLSHALGRPVEFIEQSVDDLRQVSPDYAVMFEWFRKSGYRADIAALREIYPPLMNFDSWLEQNWPAIAPMEMPEEPQGR